MVHNSEEKMTSGKQFGPTQIASKINIDCRQCDVYESLTNLINSIISEIRRYQIIVKRTISSTYIREKMIMMNCFCGMVDQQSV